MKNVFFVSIAVAIMILFVSCGVSMADTTAEKIDGAPDGYKGGKCLQPGDECINDLVCGLTVDGEKICTEPVAVTDEGTNDNDTANTAPTLEENECYGMTAHYDVVPYKIVTFGTKNFQKDLYPEGKIVDAGDNACSMIAYTQGGVIIPPVKCEGLHQVSPGKFENCTYEGALDLVDGSKGCNWNCVDYK